MRGGDPLDPAVDLEVARGDERAHALAQHLDAGARHGVDAGVAQRRERAVEPETAAIGEVPDVLRAVGVQVHARRRGLDRAGDGEVARGVFVGGEQALHAELGRAEVPGVGGDRADVVERERVGLAGRRGRSPLEVRLRLTTRLTASPTV